MSEELPSSWARLHPLSPLARAGAALVAVLLVAGPRQLLGEGIDGTRAVLDAVVAGVVLATGAVSWLVTRWRVSEGELQLELGLLRRQSLRVPLVRLQAVDVVRPLAARLLGLSELRLVLAGSGSGKARLSFLAHGRAMQVRAQLLAVGAGLHETTPEATEQPLTRVPNARLIASALVGPPAVLVALVVPVLVVLAVVEPSSVGPVLTSLATAGFGAFAVVLRRLNVEMSFTIADAPDGLRLRSGLLQTRAETIPAGRVQGVRLVEPLLWRPFGWCRLEVDVAQQREHEVGEEDVQQLSSALLPVGTREQADALLARVLPGASTRPPPGAQPPRRARFKAPLSYRRLAAWCTEDHLVGRTGRLEVRTVVVPLAKAQSIRWSQGPLQRRLRLVTVHVDTAGRRWSVAARDRDEDDADDLLVRLPDLARTARLR